MRETGEIGGLVMHYLMLPHHPAWYFHEPRSSP